MFKFKREIKGVIPLYLTGIFLLYDMIRKGASNPLFLLLDGAAFLIIAALLVRFKLTSYLVINEREVVLYRDFFISKAILIDDIRRVKFATGFLPYGKIQMKDGSSTHFRDDYLSTEAKSTLLNIVKTNS